jgi:signal transduction histidine kinase
VSDRLIGQTAFYGSIALGILVLLAFGVGWWLAGRALRPVHRMAAAARRLSSANLHERIPLHRPKDELRALGESFNALLDRLAAAFAGQQRFAANVAHELRTPLTIQRATIQIGLADPAVEPDELAAVRDELLTANRRSEKLIDRLLLLARSDAGLEHHEQLDLASVVTETIAPLTALAGEHQVELSVRADPVPVEGDPVLLATLVANLVQNALRYNRPHGRVEVVTSDRDLLVRNTGPNIAEDAVEGLFEPFQRPHDDRTGSATGTGLGLSIVRSIVTAHGGVITASPNRAGGGLTIQVRFPDRALT